MHSQSAPDWHALAGSGSHLFLAACFAGAGSLGSCRPGAYHRVDGVADVSAIHPPQGTGDIEDLTQHADSNQDATSCSAASSGFLIETNPSLVRAFKHAAIRFNIRHGPQHKTLLLIAGVGQRFPP